MFRVYLVEGQYLPASSTRTRRTRNVSRCLAQGVTRASYKKDGKEGATSERREARTQIMERLCSANESANLIGDLKLDVSETLRQQCIDDGSGDTLDSVLCAVQPAVARRYLEAGDDR